MLHPAAVGREVVQVGQPVAGGQPFEREAGERGRRLAEGETRMAAPLDQQHLLLLPQQRAGEDAAAEAGAEDGDVVVTGAVGGAVSRLVSRGES